jgi:molybdopterin molybdotransferase
MPELLRLLTLAQARGKLSASLPAFAPKTELAATADSLGRVLAGDLLCPEDLPPFARSVMDGYAVRAEDTFGASEGLPAYLPLCGEVRMGEQAPPLGPPGAMKIPTGGMLPAGADAVVMIEHTQLWDAATLEILRPVAPGENVVARGEDLKAGSALLPAGHRLRPQDVGALLAVGLTEVRVRARPRVAIFATGNEIVPPEETPGAGRVRDINSYSLGAAVSRAGGVPLRQEIVPDSAPRLESRLREALISADLVLASGGTSVGTEDLLAQVMDGLGPPGVIVHGLAIKPGKPVVIAIAQEKPLFGLPGHPTSALLVFDLLVEPLVREMAGLPRRRTRTAPARLERNLRSAPGREDFYRVKLIERDGETWACPILGKSSLISTLVEADGILHIPPETEGLHQGSRVEVQLFPEVEPFG